LLGKEPNEVNVARAKSVIVKVLFREAHEPVVEEVKFQILLVDTQLLIT
jgi:hypothetical protein